MKKFLVVAFAIVAAFSMTSCKSSKTLSDAGAVVSSPTETVGEVKPITYTNPARTNTTSAPVVGAGDRKESVTVVNSADAAKLKDYNIVVGAFGKLVNAENYRNKMVSRGYNAFLIQNQGGLYRVVAASYDNRSQAVAARDEIKRKYASDDPGTCPAAWLLIPAK